MITGLVLSGVCLWIIAKAFNYVLKDVQRKEAFREG